MKILAATTEDIDLLHRLGDEAFSDTYRDILSPAQLEYMLEIMYSLKSLEEQIVRLGHQYFIAYLDGAPIGYLSIEREGEGLYHIQKIYLLRVARGTGVGRSLLSFAFEYIRSICPEGECRAELNVNRENPAIGFYEKMGMHIARSGDFDIGGGYFMNDYIMAIDL